MLREYHIFLPCVISLKKLFFWVRYEENFVVFHLYFDDFELILMRQRAAECRALALGLYKLLRCVGSDLLTRGARGGARVY